MPILGNITADLFIYYTCSIYFFSVDVLLLFVKKGQKSGIDTRYISAVCVCACSSCPTLCVPMDCSPPDSSVHVIFQARILEWVAISFLRGSSWLRDWTLISCKVLYHWATREASNRKKIYIYLFKDFRGCTIQWKRLD